MAEKSVGTESGARQSAAEPAGPRLRMAFIGCGFVTAFHMRALKSIPDFEVVAGVDINADRLREFQQNHGVRQLYSDWNQMLREIKPDVVNVCTPNGVHTQPVIDSLNAGAHVIVEKPMAMTPHECEQMIDAADKAKRKLVTGFQFRFHPKTQFLTRARDSGEFGNIMLVKCHALRRRGIPNWGVFGRKDLQGGGPLIDIGVHILEMAHYTMGSPRPIAASGNTWTYLGDKPSDVVSHWPNWDHKTYTVEDLAAGQIRFDNGAVLQIEAMFAGHIEKDVWNFELIGDKGGAQWDPPTTFTDRAGTMVNSSAAWLPEAGFDDLFKAKLRNFADHVIHNQPTAAPASAGLAVQKMLDGIYRSAAAGKEVTIA